MTVGVDVVSLVASTSSGSAAGSAGEAMPATVPIP